MTVGRAPVPVGRALVPVERPPASVERSPVPVGRAPVPVGRAPETGSIPVAVRGLGLLAYKKNGFSGPPEPSLLGTPTARPFVGSPPSHVACTPGVGLLACKKNGFSGCEPGPGP